LCGALLVVSLAVGAAGGATAAEVSAVEQAAWLRCVIPLPKRTAWQGQVRVPLAAVKVAVIGQSSDTVATAAEELRGALSAKNATHSGDVAFTIALGVCDPQGRIGDVAVPEARELARLPNKEQAYTIQPVTAARLVLTALDERGVYYAAQTLRQLLARQVRDGQVAIPLVRITDWPDLAERGLWGGSANRDIVWMAQSKMNLVESHVELGMTADGHGRARADQERIDLGRRHALKFVPVITHLNGLGRSGLYAAHPELRGQGDRAQHPTEKDLWAPCCSHARFTEILADWMADLAAQPGVTDVCAWLSELERQHCSCADCTKDGLSQYARETRCLVRAYRLAQKRQPAFRLRVLLTLGSFPTNDQVLAQIPPDVGVTYYDGGRTYDSSREPMIYPLLQQYAGQGRWLGCYPQLTASWRIVCPWSGPQFIRTRMNEFVDKKLQCLCGYATPDNRLYEFNVLAAAEWSWNARGRSEKEYAEAWAARRGRDVEQAAHWAVTLGPVGWDVYGSGVPFPQFFGRASRAIAGRKKPQWGEAMFRYFPSREHLQADLAAGDAALQIARRLNDPQLVSETKVIGSYLRMIEACYDLAEQAAATPKPAYAQRAALQKALGRLYLAGIENTESLAEWARACSPPSGENMGGTRLADTIDVTEKTMVEIASGLRRLGIRDLFRPYLRREIGKWVTADFDQQARVTKRFEVTDGVTVAGVYDVGFQYTSGWNGLRITRVELVTEPSPSGAPATTVSQDEHVGSAAFRNRANTYTLRLTKHDPAARYYVVAQIEGTPSQGRPPERQGCNGSVWIKGQRPDDWRARVEAAQPLSDEEMARSR
jgi:hypothetical protein